MKNADSVNAWESNQAMKQLLNYATSFQNGIDR